MRYLAVAVLAVLTLMAVTLPAVPTASASTDAATSAAPNGCHTVFQPPNSWVVVCSNGDGSGGGGGGGGSGGGSGKLQCTTKLLSPDDISFFGLPKPPKGEKWAAITCPGNQAFGGVTLVSTATGAPAVTPQELLQVAENELHVPVLTPGLAPPRGADGLVGLPEWFWIPTNRQPGAPPGGTWHVITRLVSVGPVWAEVIATPERLSFEPGGGLAGSSCDGPGKPYRKGGGGQTACSFTYNQSSATQPGAKYLAAVTVTWDVSWEGSGVPLTPLRTLQMPYQFFQRVAEGQALVTGP